VSRHLILTKKLAISTEEPQPVKHFKGKNA